MATFKVLLTDKIDRAGIEILEKFADVKIASGVSENTLVEEAKDVDAIIVRVPAIITRKIIENAKRLKVIGRFGVGYDNIDVDAATEFGVVVTYTPGANTLSVAEYTLALMFALAKYLFAADKALRERRWTMRLDYPGIELTGKTLGIVGLGEIGIEVARLSKAIGMNVIYWSRTRKVEKETQLGITYIPLTSEDLTKGLRVPERLLKEADFISIHLALNEQTKGIIGEKEIAAMKTGAFFINTARGELVDERALYEALKSGKLEGAGLDVFQKEPPYESPLLTLDNVIVSPHVAALAKDSLRRVSILVAEDVRRVLHGEDPLYPVNPQVRKRK